jgi:hypothetical protein
VGRDTWRVERENDDERKERDRSKEKKKEPLQKGISIAIER